MNKNISVPNSDGSCGDASSPETNKEKIFGQIRQWNLTDKTWLLSKLAFDVQRKVANTGVSTNTYNTFSDDDTEDKVTEFLGIVRRTALHLEEVTYNQPIQQSARGGMLPADYKAKPVVKVLEYIAGNYWDAVNDYLERGKSMAQCVCAFYGGLYAQHLLGNITKVIIAKCLKGDESFSDYCIETLKKNMSPDSTEGWYKDIYKVIEEGTVKS